MIASRLLGTLQSLFRLNTVAIKDGGGVLLVRKSDDSAYAKIQASAVKLSTGAGAGLVLTSDASGNGTWQTAPGSPLIGEMKFLAYSSVPSGWLDCRGQAVSRTTYAALFAVIGTAYGAGDGSTTFNLPNTAAKFAAGYDFSTPGNNTGFKIGETGGEDTHTLTVNEMPSHTHVERGYVTGATTPARPLIGGFSGSVVDSPLVTGATGGGAAHENRPPWVVFMMVIYTGV